MTTCKNSDHLVLCFKQINNFMFEAFSTPSSKPRLRKYKKNKILKHHDELLGKYAECACACLARIIWKVFVTTMGFIGLLLFPVKSRCKPKSFTADDILCGDRQSSLLNKEEVRKLASCSLITGYQLASNVSRSHKLMISGLNSKLLTEWWKYASGSKSKKRWCLANAFLFPYTTGLGPVLSLEEMILSGVTKFMAKSKFAKAGIKVTVKNFIFEGVSV